VRLFNRSVLTYLFSFWGCFGLYGFFLCTPLLRSDYFYTGGDGSMTFYCPSNGGTTKGSSYPRSELRQLCNPSNDNDNWHIDGKHIMKATLKVDRAKTAASKVVVLQIHAFDAPPLIKIQWESSGTIYALYKENKDGDDAPKVTLGSVGYGRFDMEIHVDDGDLLVYLDGEKKLDVDVSKYWGSFTNYFKAGNYLQANSGDQYSTVRFYSLEVTGEGSCSEDPQSRAANTSSAMSTIVSLFALLLCILVQL